jgi:nitrogen fixation NifU-like protein
MPEDKFDEFVKNLQKEITDKEIEEYNEYIVSLFQKPKNWGKPPESEISVSQAYKGPCGDTMEFFLKIKNGMIEKANFITDGCGASVATGSQTTILVEGKDLNYAINLKPEIIDNTLGGLPDDHKHCAELAVRTLKKAIENYKRM